MTDESLTALGRSLQAGYQDLLVRFVPSWPDEFRLAVHDWETLSRINAEFAQLLRYIQDCLELDAWLSSGFFPIPADDAGFDPTAVGDFPRAPVGASLLAKGAVGGKPVYSRASSLLQESGRLVTPVTADRDATPRWTIPLPADSADTAAIAGSESPVLPVTTGSDSGLSGGGLRDLARLLQVTPHIDTGTRSDDKSLTDLSSFSAETAWPESVESAESAWPALTDATLPADASLLPSLFVAPMHESAEIDSGLRIVQTVSVQAKPSAPTKDPASSAVATPDNQEWPDLASFITEDLRRLGQELSTDYIDFPAIATASLPPAAASAPIVDWRKLLSILPLRREIFIAPPATPGSAGVSAGSADLRHEVLIASGSKSTGPAGMTVGDDDLYMTMPEVVQHKVVTAIPAAPNSAAVAPPDLHDLLEALSQEIWCEYQRFYGSG